MQLCSSELSVTSVETAEQQLDDLQNLTETIGKLYYNKTLLPYMMKFSKRDPAKFGYFDFIIYKCDLRQSPMMSGVKVELIFLQ